MWTGLSILRRLIAARYRTVLDDLIGRYPIRLIFHLLGSTKQFLVLGVALYVGQEGLTFPVKVAAYRR